MDVNYRFFVFALHLLFLTQSVIFVRTQNVSERYEIIEGDILIDPEEAKYLRRQSNSENSGQADVTSPHEDSQDNAVRSRRQLWITKVIPYELDRSLTAPFKKTIKAAIAEYHSKTCIKFVNRTNERRWVKFVKSTRCLSPIGKLKGSGSQDIFLGSRCNSKHIVMHEIMHTLGFWHEISRPDRDKYVEIFWENIQKAYKRNFYKYSHRQVDTLGVLYDFDSLLHYYNRAFSVNGKVTIRSRKDPYRVFGYAKSFSKLDLVKLNALYDCKGKLGGFSAWSSFSPCNYRCDKYRQRFCYSNNRRKDCPLADRHGIETERVRCPHKECYAPVNGQWSKWSEWSSCSTKCGVGNRTRYRWCSDPEPKNRGKDCVGEKRQSVGCVVQHRGPTYYRFKVQSARNNKCLSYRGKKVIVETCSRSSSQIWAWTAYDQLVHVRTGQCLQSNGIPKNNVSVQLGRCCKSTSGQQWICSGRMVQSKTTTLNLNQGGKGPVSRLSVDTGLDSQWKVYGENKNLCHNKPACRVKTKKNGCCVFPFKYLNKEYRSCTMTRTYKKLWCATSSRYPWDNKWGFCEAEPKDNGPCKVKTVEGDCCVFPFKYRRKWYKSCTNAYFITKFWCATTSNYDTDKKWGYCKAKAKPKPAACKVKTTKGGCCVFPFKYRNKWYKSCANVRSGTSGWCATTSNYDTDKKWGFCETKTKPKQAACKVKTTKGDCCVFPFKFRNKWYRSCANVQSGTSGWCATTSNFDTDRKWGACKKTTKPKRACEVRTKNGNCCVFPFKYRNKWYKTCTNAFFGNKHWCATTSNYDADKKWGFC